MSSSYVEVREAENGTEENALPIAIDTCESNGVVSVSHLDSEPQKDHTYNKEPLETQGEMEVIMSSEEVEDMEVGVTSPGKAKHANKQRILSAKKTNKVAKSSVKRGTSQKLPSLTKKVAVKEKEEKTKSAKKEEKESVSDSEDKLDGSLSDKDSLSKKRGQKRRAEIPSSAEKEPKKEKLDAKKSRPVKSKVVKKESDSAVAVAEEQQTGNETEKRDEDKPDVKETEDTSPTKSKKSVKASTKTPKKTAVGDDAGSSKGDAKLPEGWTRKVVQRKSGKTAGQFDVYIYSPDGKKLRSRPEVAAYLAKINSSLTADDFNFSVKSGSSSHSTLPVKKSTTTPAKTKSSPKASTAKATSITGKKKAAPNNSKKGVRLVVKLNFSPKKRILSNYKEQEKTASLGDGDKSDSSKKTTPKKSSPKKQKAQAKKKIPAKHSSSKK